MMNVCDLLDLDRTRARALFDGKTYPWEVLPDLSAFILALGKLLPEDEFDHPAEDVWIAKDCNVFPTAFIKGPCIIDHNTGVRQCAFIRGSALIGRDCVVGNSTELKNVLLFDHVQVPHYNYVGDSVLGYHAHLGAGAITSNVKADNSNVVIKNGAEHIPTNRRKVGAFLGDFADVGCNSVLNPGTVIGRHTQVYPTSCVRGVIPEDSIYKDAAHIVPKRHDDAKKA